MKKNKSEEFDLNKKKQRKNASNSRLREIITVLRKNDIIHGMTPERLRQILEDLGPTFVKIGQIISMRPDILPQAYCNELVKLRSSVKPISFDEIRSVLEKEYGRPYQEIFAEVVPKPLGSASIAQVHSAFLKNGTKVVIKVQRPGIRETMTKDIAFLKKATTIMKFVSKTGDAIDFTAVIEEMWVVAQQEMDFLIEANHINEFLDFQAEIAYVACPKVEKKHTTSRILVMEYIDGIQIDQLDQLKAQGYDMNEIATKLAENYIKQVIDDGFFHADPHPGNIWIRDGKIVWLDLGMMGRVSKRDKVIFKSVIMSIVNNDVHELKNAILTMGNLKGKVNHTRLYTDIDDMLLKYGNLDLGSMNLGKVIKDMTDVANVNGISMPPGISMLGRGMITLEGVLSFCAPEINFIQILANHISSNLLSDFDFNKELRQMGLALYNFSRKSIEIPAQLSDVLKMTIKGQTKLNLDITGSEEPIRQLDKMVDKIVLCIINAALLIGSSLICTTQMQPKIMGIPFLGAIGFLGASILSIWLLYGVLSNRKR